MFGLRSKPEPLSKTYEKIAKQELEKVSNPSDREKKEAAVGSITAQLRMLEKSDEAERSQPIGSRFNENLKEQGDKQGAYYNGLDSKFAQYRQYQQSGKSIMDVDLGGGNKPNLINRLLHRNKPTAIDRAEQAAKA